MADSPQPLPLIRRFPALARLPHAELGSFPSPVMRATELSTEGELWVKRDDLDAPAFGGNKVRALEFLLGGVQPGDELLTAGGEGSTHVLATAALGQVLGARTTAVRWRHEMNPMARDVAACAAELCEEIRTTRGPIMGLLRALLARRASAARWIPLGGTSPLGILGHVNAGLELAEQVERGELPPPSHVAVPLGSGGTAAGLALGFAIAGLEARVAAARVAPRLAANHWRVLALARSCARLIERLAGQTLPRLTPDRVQVVHDVYAGAYGRPLPAAREAAALFECTTGIRLDDTYSAKAFAAALALARGGSEPVVFWLTFDARAVAGDG